MLIVRIYRLENGVPQNSGIGFFVDAHRILSAFHIYGHLERQDLSTYIAVFNNQCFPITPIRMNCAKDLVLYQSNHLSCPLNITISATELKIGDKVCVKSIEREIITPIFSIIPLVTSIIQFNYTCLLNVDIFYTENPCDPGMSGSIVINEQLEIVGLYSGNASIANLLGGAPFGMCINRNEIVAFINAEA
jgi:hypothetical protein